ncbi:MAG: 2OG-Fe(II) oxygenase, partial [Planctomycetes bacterium]|nr:2OG-Fe(II) oxygenase [Planctomycetota bacterium]
MNQLLADIIDLEQYPLDDDDFRAVCRRTLDENGALVMRQFVKPTAIASIQSEGEANQHLAYYTV